LSPDHHDSWTDAVGRGLGKYYVTPNHFADLANLPAPAAADRLVQRFLPGRAAPAYRASVLDYLANGQGTRLELLTDAAAGLVQTPYYQLC
jgi:hypothetical protein